MKSCKIPTIGFPVVAQQKRIWLASMRKEVRSLALLSALKIWYCYELWCRSQMQLKSGDAVAVAYASSYSSDSIPSLGTSICHRCRPKKKKKKKRKEKKNYYSAWCIKSMILGPPPCLPECLTTVNKGPI